MSFDAMEKEASDCLIRLREHFDVVVIVGSFEQDDGTTAFFSLGRGNHFAREGMLTEYLRRIDSQDRAGRIAEAINQRDEDEA
jgi:hypothetical protein